MVHGILSSVLHSAHSLDAEGNVVSGMDNAQTLVDFLNQTSSVLRESVGDGEIQTEKQKKSQSIILSQHLLFTALV